MSDDITLKDGNMYGGWRKPVNIWMDLPGSIHNDDVAEEIGMRGGTIPGTIHLNLFPPLLLKAFGQQWFEKGSISMYYTYATMHLEETRAVIGTSEEGAKDVQVEAWAEMKDGKKAATGTVSVGDAKEPSYLQSQELKNAESGDLQILAGLKAGDKLPSNDVLVKQGEPDKVLDTITDPLDWYKSDSPWGGPILYPAAMYHALMLTPKFPENKKLDAVGFFGATEIRIIDGPIKVGVPYEAKGELICVGASPKTEYFWYDSYLEEKESGKRVAEMRKMTRFMKASSPLYQVQEP
jgi:hypothetical protein